MSKKSETFDNFVKIALEKGLIKQEEIKTALRSDDLKPKTRDQVTNRDYEKARENYDLYDLKIKQLPGMEYENNIVEYAHPIPVILPAPTYDKINALVENVNERQNIILNLLSRPVTGNNFAFKLAEDLSLSLIRTAGEMDLKDQEELMVLADTCATQLKKLADEAKSFNTKDLEDVAKQYGETAVDVGGGAATGAAIGAVAGGLIGALGGPFGIGAGLSGGAWLGGAAGGVISSIMKTSPEAKNVAINANIAREELEDLMKDFPGDVLMHTLHTALIHISSTASMYANTVDKMHLSNNKTDGSLAKNIAEKYMTELNNLQKTMGLFLADAKSGKYKKNESDFWSKVKKPFNMFSSDDVEDEVKALETLNRVIFETQKVIQTAQQQAQELSDKVEETQATPYKSPSQALQHPEESNHFNNMFDDFYKLSEEFGHDS